MQGVKKKSKAGQERAEDRAEQARSLPRGARPLGMQNRHKSAEPAGAFSKLLVLVRNSCIHPAWLLWSLDSIIASFKSLSPTEMSRNT